MFEFQLIQLPFFYWDFGNPLHETVASASTLYSLSCECRTMEQFQNHDFEYMVDDYYDMTDFEDVDSFVDFEEQRMEGRGGVHVEATLDSDFEDDFEMSKPKNDISALEVRNGKDIQGIPWERLNYGRKVYRQVRVIQYKNYENLSRPRGQLKKECKRVRNVYRGREFYDFQYNTRLVKPTIVHFQLRNLLSATSKHDVYLVQNYSVMHWSCLLRKGKEVFNVANQIVPTLKRPASSSHSLSRVQISTMSVKDNIVVAGGFHGELICKNLNQSGVAFCTRLTTDENAITNAVEVYSSPSGSIRVTAANNDARVRVFDGENFACLGCFSFPWSVNDTSVSPDGKLLAILGDDPEGLLTEAQSGKVVGTLRGHLDYSFASAWHPDGRILATGNQDTTCRLWDVRNLSQSLAVLKGRMGSIRALTFTSDGRFLAMAEPLDFVHIFNTKSNYTQKQEIDLFGEIAGISFSPDAETLFIGVADRVYGGLLEFIKRHYNHYLDSVF